MAGAQLKGPDGSPPVYAINGRRPLDANEVNTLPFDGIQSIELLRLSELAGTPVSIAAIPQAPAARGTLVAYLPGANRPNVTDLGPYRSLRPRQDKAVGLPEPSS